MLRNFDIFSCPLKAAKRKASGFSSKLASICVHSCLYRSTDVMALPLLTTGSIMALPVSSRMLVFMAAAASAFDVGMYNLMASMPRTVIALLLAVHEL